MKKMFGCVWMIAGSFSAFADSSEWRMQPVQIPTRWAASVTPTHVWPEYPRPQLVRPQWQNLNGLWDYVITEAGATVPSHFQGSILVPYPLESALSGVAKQLKHDQLLWYRRLITLKPQDRQRILLHFGAVDYQATVFINGRQVGIHIYTQLTDVEQEQNGLMTYDRQVARIAVAELWRANKKLIPQAQNSASSMHGFSIADADHTPESARYAKQLAEYQRGKREMSFLRSLTLMALRQQDKARATQIGNEFISRSPEPYSRNTWQFISATTQTSKDKGFRILREQTEQAKAMLGQNVVEKRIREVIRREEIEPLLSVHEKEGSATLDWTAVEKRVGAKYGPLGAEAVRGAAMMDYMRKADWANFGNYYARYFSTAATRSEYPINTLSYAVFQHVKDGATIAAAIAAIDASMDMNETYGPVDVDTYAGLLYKIGRRQEAIQWQEKAVRFSDGQDAQIVEHLMKMRADQPTWAAR